MFQMHYNDQQSIHRSQWNIQRILPQCAWMCVWCMCVPAVQWLGMGNLGHTLVWRSLKLEYSRLHKFAKR